MRAALLLASRILVLLCVSLLSLQVSAAQPSEQAPNGQSEPVKIDPDGTVHVPAMAVPLSSYMSEEAKQRFIKGVTFFSNVPRDLPIVELRKVADEKFFRPRIDFLKARYSVAISEEKIGDIPAYIVTPKEGVPDRNRSRVLVNFHGGGFTIGRGLGQLLEAIPIAAVGRIKVVSVDYRMAPEHHFPAASEDAMAVYSSLLKKYRPQNVGFYGCSAGGELTAQAVAWLRKQGLPRPGAIGIFSAGAYGSHTGPPTAPHVWGGDSRYTNGPLVGYPPLNPANFTWPQSTTDYISNLSPADFTSPLLAPALSQETLKEFPPTLLLTGTRAGDMSAAVQTQRLLTKAGVEADLHLWDGMHHCFIYEADLPEAQEAYQVIARFFDQHLGKR